MFKFKSLLLPFMVICLVGLFTGSTELSAENPGEKIEPPIAGMTIGANGIEWMPGVEYHQLVLTVSGPDGTIFTKTFQAGASPFLDISGNNGKYLADGSYTYELRVIPDAPKRVRENGEAAGVNSGGPPFQETLTQTGYFQVRNGRFVTPAAPETGIANPMDIVHSDDVIIDGSLCVGNDCYSGLDFGFDTIVLMENNLRIFFDDTSSIQNYPRNDWRIICNDSTDGGGNYFAVQDATDVSNILVMEAGAPNNSLYVDSHGDVGINTSTPYYELHIVDGDSPAIRLDQDGSYGWTPQKWDLCGNESNFFIRDATNASKLPFRIEPSAPTNSIFIKSNGSVGIGTGSPGYALEVERTGENAAIVCERTSGVINFINATASYGNFGTVNNFPMQLMVNSDWKVRLNSDNSLTMRNGATCSTAGEWLDSSSRELKEKITNLSVNEATDALNGLTPVKFRYKTDKEYEQVGFIAEDVPELVATKTRKNLGAMDIVAVLTKVVQQQQETIREQQEISEEYRKLISELNKRITELEKK